MPSFEIETQNALNGKKLPKAFPPPTKLYTGRVLFAATLATGAVAADAVVLNGRTFANLRDANLRRNFGYGADNPQLVARVFGVRVSVARPNNTMTEYVDENTQRLLAENLVLKTGPDGAPKYTQIGTDLGTLFDGGATGTTVAATTIDRSSKRGRITPIGGGGDYIDFTSDNLQLIADQAFTTTSNARILLEVWGVFARRQPLGWERQNCEPFTPQDLRGGLEAMRTFMQG